MSDDDHTTGKDESPADGAERPSIPDIGIGTYDVEPEDCIRSVRTALECGYRHVDTAEMYDTEAAVGTAMDQSAVDREAVFVATKLHSRNLGYEDVLEHARASREKLGVDVIDLLYVHWPIRTYDPVETLAALDELYDEGLLHHVGLSNFTPALLEEALEHLEAPLFAHQVECHPLLQQDELRTVAREHGHTLVAYSPLAKGSVMEVPELVEIARTYDVTPAQISLAWLLSKQNVAVIPKSTTPAHIRENYEGADLELAPEDIERIDGIERAERVVDFPEAPWNVSEDTVS